MKLNSFLLPALAGVAAADSAPQHAAAFMLRHTRQTTTSSPPSIPHSLAEAILLQRLSSSSQPSALGRLPQSLDDDEAVSYINKFARPVRPLFDSSDIHEPKQLVIAFEGGNSHQYKKLKASIPVPLTFTAPGLDHLPIKASTACSFTSAINPVESDASRCWSGPTQYLQYDVTKNSDVIKQLGSQLAALESYAKEGLMETTIVFLESSDSATLHRRQLQFQKDRETVKSSVEEDTTFVSSVHDQGSSSAFAGRPAKVPTCFKSQDACESATNTCSGHGACVDRWGMEDTDNSCFFCHCIKTVEKKNGTNHIFYWGGDMCHKQDVSTPFWLFAGITIALVSTVGFCIGLLFTVGEEKLPGVIGAGVSRTK